MPEADATGPGATWARAVALGGEGRYAAAETLLRGLRAGQGVPAVLRAHASVTRASHLRQMGAHARATGFDAAAARIARPLTGGTVPGPGADPAGTGPAAALGDALAGLAADAIGRRDAVTARRMLDRAAPWCGVPGGDPPVSRTAVRWLWVRAETSLLTGDADGAVSASATACALAGGLGSRRHEVKSRLVHAVARMVAADPLPGELDAIAADAEAAGLLPLHWAASMAAADAPPEGGVGPVPGEGPVRPNGRHARGAQLDTLSRQTVAQSRRHAAMLTMNAVYLRSDPVVRARIRESPWLPADDAVP